MEYSYPVIAAGSSDFREIVMKTDMYVDKSLLIKELLPAASDTILIVRPRRWGKSLNLDMLRRFFEIEVDSQGNPLPEEQKINSKLFIGGEVDIAFEEIKHLSPLKIARYQDALKHQGKYPIITISFKEVNGNNFEQIVERVKKKITILFSQHYYLLNSKAVTTEQRKYFSNYLTGDFSSTDLENSLFFLSELLFQHYKRKVFIFIDEYDSPINSAFIKCGYKSQDYEDIIELFRNMFSFALKTNDYLAKGVVTGILRIAKANLFSGLNNLTENSLFSKTLSSSYGFTQEEVEQLLGKVKHLGVNAEEVKRWYNGYLFGGQTIYNPWSIMQCLYNRGELSHYWIDSGGTNIIDHVLRSDERQEDLQALITGQEVVSHITPYISFDTIDSASGLYSLLLFTGYLNAEVLEAETEVYELSIPNREVAYIYQNRLLEWITGKTGKSTNEYYHFVELLAEGRFKEFKEQLQEIISVTSFYQTGKTKAESFYSGLMTCIFSILSSRYLLEYESESGRGRADALLISKEGAINYKKQPLKNAIIVEYKVCNKEENLFETAKKGLEQINEKGYIGKIKQYKHVREVYKLGIAFCGKEVAVEWEVEQVG